MNARKARGVTLIELMVVITVIAILAGIAMPAYTQYITKTKRGIAKSILAQVANREEQYFLDNKSYTTDLTKLSYPASRFYVGDDSNPTSASSGAVYLVSVSGTSRTYTITATPQGGQAANDTTCASFTLDEKGAKGVSGGSGSASDCW